MPTIRALCIAGLASSTGKTTVTLALAAAFRRRGLRVRCAKVGPDFIDPGFHAAVSGEPSRTLDSWMLPPDELRRTLARCGADADLVLVEGMMGLFDGLAGDSEAGSTAEVAKRLGIPVLLVVDASAQARSAGASVLGVERFDPALTVAGVILNRVGGSSHVASLRDAIAGACRTPVVGTVPWQDAVTLPERHLGLVTAAEGRFLPELFRRLADLADSGIQVDRCLRAARSDVPAATPAGAGPVRIRLGVARDEAFQFYYPDGLEALAHAGAEIIPWSPLADAALPDVDALFLGGGYPEVHAVRLSANGPMRAAVAAFARAGGLVYAECGGLMYLTQSLEDLDGQPHPMVGVLPARVRMTPARLTLGYREVRLGVAGLFGAPGTRLRGHEFHRSYLDPPPAHLAGSDQMTDPTRRDRGPWAFRIGRTWASYAHLHLGSAPGAAAAFVQACRPAGAGGLGA